MKMVEPEEPTMKMVGLLYLYLENNTRLWFISKLFSLLLSLGKISWILLFFDSKLNSFILNKCA